MTSGIYGIQNTVNNKWYIGQSVNLRSRSLGHFRLLRAGKHFNRHLQSSFNAAGIDCFKFYIIESIEESSLDYAECFWIAFLHTTNSSFGYNLDSGGSFSKRASLETKLKLSLSHKGKKLSPESKLKQGLAISKALKGKPASPRRLAALRILTEAQKGVSNRSTHPWLPITRAKLSASKKGKSCPWSEARRQAYKDNIKNGKFQEMCARISNKLKGKKPTEETRKKLSLAQIKRRSRSSAIQAGSQL